MRLVTRFLCLALGLLLTALAPVSSEAGGRALYFLFDTSGSLRSDDLAAARQLARRYLDTLGPDDVVGVMSFDDEPHLLAPLGSEREEVLSALGVLSREGRYTALYDAVWDASESLGARPGVARGIVLLTDGRDENSALLFEDARRSVTEHHVRVFAIGIGERRDERFLRRFAKLSDGLYFDRDAVAEPDVVIAQIAGSFAALPAPVPETATTAGRATPGKLEPAPRAPSIPSREAATIAAGPETSATAAARGAPTEPEVAARSGARGWAKWMLLPVAVVALGWLARGRPTTPPQPAAESGVDTLDESSGRDPLDAPIVRAGGPVSGSDDPTVIAGDEGLEQTLFLAERPMLLVRKGASVGTVYPLESNSDTFIGRSRINDIVIDDKAISSRHVRVRAEGKLCTVLDLSSTNGSFLNNRRLDEEMFLEAGDIIRVGETEFVFEVEQTRP